MIDTAPMPSVGGSNIADALNPARVVWHAALAHARSSPHDILEENCRAYLAAHLPADHPDQLSHNLRYLVRRHLAPRTSAAARRVAPTLPRARRTGAIRAGYLAPPASARRRKAAQAAVRRQL